MQRLTTAVLVTAVLVGCSDSGTRDATAPDVNLRFAAGGPGSACSAKLNKAVGDQQTVLYSGATLQQAQDLWFNVSHDCKTNLALAQSEMFTYVQFTINQSLAYGGSASNGLTVQHWNSVFPYVGLIAPNLADSVLSSQGGAAVVPNPAVSTEVRTIGPYAAITIYNQDANGDQRTHLITINPLNGVCLSGTVHQVGPCFEFSANPSLSPGGFSPKALVGVCQPVTAAQHPGGISPGLGHQTSNGAQVFATQLYPTFCVDVVADLNTGSWHGGLKGITTRLAYLARHALTPASLYAEHGGLGGTTDFISPFAGVDRMIFKATFTGNTLNAFPGTPEAGTWTSTIQPPGSILVQASLGNITDTLVVLSQAGGNCANCGALELRGQVVSSNDTTRADDTGIFFVDWQSLQDGPTVKSAPFILRATDGTEIARVTYKSVQSTSPLFYNDGTTPVGAWVQHVSQHFRIVVNFYTRTTTLYIDDMTTPVATGTLSTAVHNIGRIAAEFSGIDSGTMGWDNITIERQVDQ
jgi:hypothetical protein